MFLKYLIIFSLCLLTLSINTNAAPTENDNAKSASKEEDQQNANSTPKPERVSVIKKSDSYVVARVLVELKEVAFNKISLVFAVEMTNKEGKKEWVYSDNDPTVSVLGVKSEVIAKAHAGNYYQYDLKITNLKPELEFKLKFIASYGTESEEVGEVVVKTIPKAPETKVTPNLLTLQFEKYENAIKYYAKVTKLENDKETDCVLEATMSPCFGNSLGLPGLMSGGKYKIDVWYIGSDNTESEHWVQEISA